VPTFANLNPYVLPNTLLHYATEHFILMCKMYLNHNIITILLRRNMTLKYHKLTFKGNDLTPTNLKIGGSLCFKPELRREAFIL
jgi:hypothetical protein